MSSERMVQTSTSGGTFTLRQDIMKELFDQQYQVEFTWIRYETMLIKGIQLLREKGSASTAKYSLHELTSLRLAHEYNQALMLNFLLKG